MNNGGQAHRSLQHFFRHISNRQGSSHSALNLKKRKTDFYAIDSFIVTQNIFWANPPPGAPVGYCTLSKPYKNALK